MAFIKNPNPVAIYADNRSQSRDCASLAEQLASQDPLVRRWAARDLADCPTASATLVARLACEPDISVREIIFSSLASLGDEVAVAGLIDCLRSEDALLRNESIEILKQLPDAVAPIMENMLVEPDADLRIFAVNILESLCHPDVEKWLINVIERDVNVNVCATALDLLVEVGSNISEPALTQLKVRFANEPYICFAVDMALQRIAKD